MRKPFARESVGASETLNSRKSRIGSGCGVFIRSWVNRGAATRRTSAALGKIPSMRQEKSLFPNRATPPPSQKNQPQNPSKNQWVFMNAPNPTGNDKKSCPLRQRPKTRLPSPPPPMGWCQTPPRGGSRAFSYGKIPIFFPPENAGGGGGVIIKR